MSNKLLSRLLSFTMSATVALTSGVPALAYDGGGGEDLLEVEDEELLEIEDEIELEDAGADFDAQEEDVEDNVLVEDEAEFEFYEDAQFTIAAANFTHAAAYTIAGDVATKISDDDGETIDFDSTKDFVFYVAPAMGYNWATVATPVAVAGTYKKSDTDEAYTAKKDVDFKIEASDISYASIDGELADYNDIDWAFAKKVTIVGGSKIAKALAEKKALVEYATPPTLTVTLTEAAEAQKVQIYTVYEDGLTKPNVDLAANTYRPVYAHDYNTEGNLAALISTADKDKDIDVAVSLVGSDTIKLTPDTDYTWAADTKTLSLPSSTVNRAYLMAKKGYKLTVTFSEGDDVAEVTTINVAPKSTDYVTFAKVESPINADGTGKTKITTKGIDITKNTAFSFFAYKDSALDSSREILGIYYQVAETADAYKIGTTDHGTVKKIKVKNNGEGAGTYAIEGSTGYDELESPLYTEYSARYYSIPASLKDVTLTAVTAEQVEIKNAFDETAAEDGKAMAAFTVNGHAKTIGSDLVTLTAGDTSGGTISEAITGKDYTFYVTPTAGYAVSNVVVDMYNKAGTSSTSYTVAKGNLIAGDFGKYTVPAITGRLVVTITAAAESATLKTVEKKLATDTDDADIRLYRLSDKKQITTTAQKFAEAGAAFSFKAVPAAGKAIKSVSYAVSGSDEYTTLTGTPDGEGNLDYTISNVSDNISIKVESEVGFTVTNVGNPNAVVKVNGITIKDGKAVGGFPIGTEGITVSVVGSTGTVKNVWYSWGAAELSEGNSALYALSKTGGAIAKNTLNNFVEKAATYRIFIYAQTEREAKDYTATVTSADAGKKVTALELFAGGSTYAAITANAAYDTIDGVTDDASEANDGDPDYTFAFDDLTVAFARKDYKAVASSDATNTTYSLSKTGDAAVAKFFPQYSSSNTEAPGFNRIVTTKLAGTDTITIKEVVDDVENGWLDKVSYSTTLGLTVKALDTYYDGGIAAVSTVASAYNGISGMTGANKTVLRTYKASKFEDSAALTLQPYTIDSETGKAKKRASVIAAGELDGTGADIIKSIAWTTDPIFSETQTTDARMFTLSALTGATTTVSAVKNAGNIKATATITYVDGSKDVADVTLTAVDQTYGYYAVAIVTQGANTNIALNDKGFALEKRSGGINSATVKYRVFEALNSAGITNAIDGIGALVAKKKATAATEAIIDEYLASEANINVKEVTATFDGCKDADEDEEGFEAVTASNSGNTYTITASQVGLKDKVVALGEVNGIPVSVPALTVTVVNTFETATLTMNTEDASGGTNYTLPQIKKTAAILNNSHSNQTSDEYGKISGFVFDKLTVDDTITLPAVADFDAATINPKRTLVAWSDGSVWYAPGATYTIAAGKTLTAMWASKYSAITVYNDLTDAAIGQSAVLGIGLSIPLSLRYKVIDSEATLKAKTATYADEFTTVTTGFTVTKADETSTALSISGTTVKGEMTNAGAVVNYKWVDGEAEYKTSEICTDGKPGSGEDNPADTGSTSFNVQTAKAYKLEMDAISVEAGQTKAFNAYYFLADKARKDTFLFNDGAVIESVSAEIKKGGEDNAVYAGMASTAENGNTISITGLKANTTATLVLSVVSVQNEKKEIEVPITVTTSKKQIVIKVAEGEVAPSDIEFKVSKSENAEDILENNHVTFNYYYNGNIQSAEGTWTVAPVDYDEDFEGTKAFRVNPDTGKVVTTGFAVAAVSEGSQDATATIPTLNDTFGTGRIKVTYENGDDVFSAWFDVNTYYELVFEAQTGGEEDGARYVVYNDGVKIKNGADITEKIVYSGATTYTVANAAKYLAVYPTGEDASTGVNTDEAKQFLGWKTGGVGYTATEATFAAGEAIVLKPATNDKDKEWPFTPAASTVTLSAQFGVNPITNIEGLPSVIRLTDENVGLKKDDVDSSSNDLTDYESYQITQNPQDTAATISVTADDIGLFTIIDGKTPDRTATVDEIVDHEDLKNTKALWGTDKAGTGKVTMTAVGKVSKIGNFTIAKVDGKVGTSEVHVTSGELEYDIPVYLNGEYLDNKVTPNVYRYMEDGEILKEGSRVVEGKAHFYKDSELVLNDIVTVTAADGSKKLIMVEAGVQVTTPKNNTRAFNGKTYYIQADGYLGTGVITISDKNYLFREDGSKVFHTDSDVKDGKISVGGIGYVIADDDTAELDDVFYNAKVNWTKKFDSKYTKGTGLPEIQYTITYTSKNSGKSITTDEVFHATVTCDGDYSATSTATKLTFTATADLTGYWKDADAKEAATAAPLTETYTFKNGGLYGTTGQEIGGDMMVDGLEESYYYTGQPIKPVIVVTDGDMVLAQGVDYTVTYSNNKKISSKSGDEYTPTAQVIVKGKGNYEGQAQTLYFAIIDPKDAVEEDDLDVKGFSIKLPKEDHYYTGEAHYPSSITLKKGKTEYTYQHEGDGLYTNTEGEIPAVVTFSNNVNKGSATVCVTGKDKSIKKSFQIKAAEFNGDFEVQVDESAAWAVKGAQPTVGIAWNGAELVPGQDFKVSYSKNKAIGTATAKITGKGNFKGKLEKSFSVVALPLSEEMVAAVSALVGKKGAKVTLLDGVGNVIPTSKYTVSVLDGETDITKTTKLEAEKDYTIRIAKKTAELDGDPIDVTVQAGIDVKAAKVNAKSVVKTYTGEAITLTDEDIAKIAVTYKGATLVAGTDFEITGYANNIKKGSMTVTIKGIGKYSGAKTFKVKIAPKPIKATN